MGNPASVMYALKRHYDIEIVSSLPTSAHLENLLFRSFSKLEINYITKEQGLFTDLIAKINNGKLLYLDCDISEDNSKVVNFLNSNFLLPDTAPALSIMTNVPLYFVYTISNFPTEEIFISKIELPDSAIQSSRRQKIKILHEKIIQEMESLIIKYPERWMWILFSTNSLIREKK